MKYLRYFIATSTLLAVFGVNILFSTNVNATSDYDNLISDSTKPQTSKIANNCPVTDRSLDWSNVLTDSSYWNLSVGSSYSEVNSAFSSALSNGTGWTVSTMTWSNNSGLGNYDFSAGDKSIVITLTASSSNFVDFATVGGYKYSYLHTNNSTNVYRVYVGVKTNCELGVAVAIGEPGNTDPTTLINDGFYNSTDQITNTRSLVFANSTINYPEGYEGSLIKDSISSDIFYPARPKISYSVKGKHVKIDCLNSDFFESNSNNKSTFDYCSLFIDKTINDSANNNLEFYTGSSIDGTISNVVDNDTNSENHLAAGQRVTDSYYCSIVSCYLEYDFDDFGTYYLKATITTSNGSNLTSAVETPIIINGSSYKGDTDVGTIVPSIYKDCSVFNFALDPGGWWGCSISNVQTWFTKTLSDLFIPDFEFISNTIQNLNSVLSDKLGFIYYPVTFSTNVLSSTVFTSLEPNCNFSFGSILSGRANINYNFCSFEDSLPTAFLFIRSFIIGLTSVGLLFMLYNKLNNILRGSDS